MSSELHCSGELWDLETWRLYHDYTSLHFLLLYIMVLLFTYFVIKCGRRLPNDAFNNQPPAVDASPAAPGAYRTFSSSASNTSRDTIEKSTLINMVHQLKMANQGLASITEHLEAANSAIESSKADYVRGLKQTTSDTARTGTKGRQ